MAELLPGIGSVDWFGALSGVMYYVGIFFLAIVILAVMVVVFYMFKFNIKATVFPLYGSGKDGTFSFGRPKKNRVMWNKQRTAWIKLFPLFNKKEIEPFDTEFVYPGKRIFVFELNDEWVPGRININQTEEELRAEINPVPYYIRNWQSLTYKKHAAEFAKQDFWTENKQLLMTIATVAICCALVGAVIYFTFQFAGGAKESIDAMTSAIRGMQTIQGAPR